MKISVIHQTVFEYGGPVWDSVNTLHLEPRNFPKQETLESIIKVLPATQLNRFDDLFGNVAHHFEIGAQHHRLEVESQVKVETFPLDIPDEGMSGGLEMLGEAEIHEATLQYLSSSHWVSINPEIWRRALDLTNGLEAVYSKATSIMEWIHNGFEYVSGVTDADTHVEVVFGLRKGVCQDFTHVMIALCRAVGIPARYASGYLYNGPLDTLVGSQASHAWCEVFLPGTGWTGFDPTNSNLADERYVKIAVGRDYADVAPISGSYRGSSHCRMEVNVLVEKP
jgi:transglutaminase-like putative cysteine protease